MRKQPGNHERFEEFKSHEFWQTTFVKLKFRTNDDHRTTRVVDTLTKKVLTEATLLTFEKIRKGFELTTTILGAGLTTMVGVIVDQSVNCLLEHAHFVMNNHFWRIEVEQFLQAVITVNHTAVKIVKIGSRETTTR